MLDCYVYFVKCFFSLSCHLTENTVSVVQTSNGELSWMCLWLQYKCLLFLCEFNKNRDVSINFSRNTKYEISRRFTRWGSRCSMHTDVTGLSVVACRDCFVNASTNHCWPVIRILAYYWIEIPCVKNKADVKSKMVITAFQSYSRNHPASCSPGTEAPSPRKSDRRMKLNTQLYLLRKLRMSGAIPLLPLRVFVSHTSTTLPFPYNVDSSVLSKTGCIVNKMSRGSRRKKDSSLL
jgi:hypothetical protein